MHMSESQWLDDVRQAQLSGTIGSSFAVALGEIQRGAKTSHWVWYVFPQIPGLGSSSLNRRFAVPSPAAAEAFLRDPTTGPNFQRIVASAVDHLEAGITLRALLGDDVRKFVSSTTLFEAVSRHASLEQVANLTEAALSAARREGFSSCEVTKSWLAEHGLSGES